MEKRFDTIQPHVEGLAVENKSNIYRFGSLYDHVAEKVKDFFAQDENKKYQPIMETITKKTGVYPIRLIFIKRELEKQGNSPDEIFAKMKATADYINFERTAPTEVLIKSKKPSFGSSPKTITQAMKAVRIEASENIAKQKEVRQHQYNTDQLRVKVTKPGQVQPALDQKEKIK